MATTQSPTETGRPTAAHLHEKDPKGDTLHEGQVLLPEAEKMPRHRQNLTPECNLQDLFPE